MSTSSPARSRRWRTRSLPTSASTERSICEVDGGVYTGRTLAGLYGEGKADAVRELAAREGIDLAASTAYSDSAADLPFLEAVGKPVAVNPDRRLRRIARERAWPVLEFREPAQRRAA